jgi:Mg-chelatase subunit ChlD
MQHDFILLDRSGSMGPIWDETLSSVNAYVAKLAKDKVDTGVTLATFDSDGGKFMFEIIRDRIIPRTWRRVSNEDCTPRGYTPLNDATARIVSLARKGNYDKVAMVIVTDGLENASKELAGHAGVLKVKAMLDECRSKNWQVIFLGANFDNAIQASLYGNSAAATMSMDSGQMVNSTRATASKRAQYGVSGQSISFTDEEKAELNKKN